MFPFYNPWEHSGVFRCYKMITWARKRLMTDFLCKSVKWFLYDWHVGRYFVSKKEIRNMKNFVQIDDKNNHGLNYIHLLIC